MPFNLKFYRLCSKNQNLALSFMTWCSQYFASHAMMIRVTSQTFVTHCELVLSICVCVRLNCLFSALPAINHCQSMSSACFFDLCVTTTAVNTYWVVALGSLWHPPCICLMIGRRVLKSVTPCLPWLDLMSWCSNCTSLDQKKWFGVGGGLLYTAAHWNRAVKHGKWQVSPQPHLCLVHVIIYRLDDESRQLWDLDRRRNQCIDVKCVAVHFGFQGDLNPVVADDSSSKVSILQQRGNEKYNTNMLPVDMAERRIENFVWLFLVEAWTVTVMEISEESYWANLILLSSNQLHL